MGLGSHHMPLDAIEGSAQERVILNESQGWWGQLNS